MFCIGERICYPMHGIGEIEGIEQRRVLGVNARYYLLKFDSGRVSAMVPVETAEKIGLRRPVTREESERVMSLMENQAWRARGPPKAGTGTAATAKIAAG